MVSILLLFMLSLFLGVLPHDKVVKDWYSLVLAKLHEVKCWDLNIGFIVIIGDIDDVSTSLRFCNRELRLGTWLDELFFLYLSPVLRFFSLFLRTINR